jgi:hypothetical protein
MLQKIRNMIRPEPKRDPLPKPKRVTSRRAVADTADGVSEIGTRPATPETNYRAETTTSVTRFARRS